MTLVNKTFLANIKDARTIKHTLETDLLRLIKYFEEDTGLKITDINLITEYKITGESKVINLKVTVEV